MKYGEKFVNVDEREKEFLLFCNGHSDDGSCVKCPLNNKSKKRLGCAYAWLDLEVEKEKPMNCPLCGNKCVVTQDIIKCLHCAYTSGDYDHTASENIAAHNRVCKAVAAYKGNN